MLSFRVIDKSMKNFKAFFRWLYVGESTNCSLIQYRLWCSRLSFYLLYFMLLPSYAENV